jgi:hypothetical protein
LHYQGPGKKHGYVKSLNSWTLDCWKQIFCVYLLNELRQPHEQKLNSQYTYNYQMPNPEIFFLSDADEYIHLMLAD